MSQLLFGLVGIVFQQIPSIISLSPVDVIGNSAVVHHVTLLIFHPIDDTIEHVRLGIALLAAAPEDGKAATFHLDGCTVILADQPRDAFHAVIDDVVDVGGGKWPKPISRDFVVDLDGGEAHDLVASHAGIPNDAEVAQGHAFESRLEEVEWTA